MPRHRNQLGPGGGKRRLFIVGRTSKFVTLIKDSLIFPELFIDGHKYRLYVYDAEDRLIAPLALPNEPRRG
jgi:hypothetical protein